MQYIGITFQDPSPSSICLPLPKQTTNMNKVQSGECSIYLLYIAPHSPKVVQLMHSHLPPPFKEGRKGIFTFSHGRERAVKGLLPFQRSHHQQQKKPQASVLTPCCSLRAEKPTRGDAGLSQVSMGQIGERMPFGTILGDFWAIFLFCCMAQFSLHFGCL